MHSNQLITTALLVLCLLSCKTTSSDPTAKWRWQVPSPPTPTMAWVPAGSFRTSDRTPGLVTTIVIHTTEGKYKDELSFTENQNANFSSVVNYFKENDRNVSAHFVMGPNGEVCSMVNEKDVAHTQTYYNGRAIGIECAGWSSRPETWTPEMLESLVNLCAYLCVKWEVPAYQPEGTAYEGPWSLVVDEETKRFTGPGLVGHYQIQPWNKTDPGEHFPWDDFTERVRTRIQEYGVEPIQLPAPDATQEVVVTAKIREASVVPGEPFTWVLTIAGPNVDSLTTSDVVFPAIEKIPTLELISGPLKTVNEPSRAMFELTLKSTTAEPVELHAGRVKLGGLWYDSPTVSVKPKAAP